MKRKLKLRIQKVRRELLDSTTNICTFCPTCEAEVELLSFNTAARFLEISADELDRLISLNLIHAMETISGTQKICKNSLFARAKHFAEKVIELPTNTVPRA